MRDDCRDACLTRDHSSMSLKICAYTKCNKWSIGIPISPTPVRLLRCAGFACVGGAARVNSIFSQRAASCLRTSSGEFSALSSVPVFTSFSITSIPWYKPKSVGPKGEVKSWLRMKCHHAFLTVLTWAPRGCSWIGCTMSSVLAVASEADGLE